MKIVNTLLVTPSVLLATQAQAAVDISGFTVEQASRPYGLFALALVLAGIGLAYLRRTH